MSETLNDILDSIVRIVVIPLLPVITAFIIAFIKKKTAELQKNLDNRDLDKYLSIAEDAVITAVTTVNQIYTDDLKKKNGSLSPYEQKVAFEMAREKTLKILGNAALNMLSLIYEDIDSWLENKIEYYVNALKSTPPGIEQRVKIH
jgi:hypothetical protein